MVSLRQTLIVALALGASASAIPTSNKRQASSFEAAFPKVDSTSDFADVIDAIDFSKVIKVYYGVGTQNYTCGPDGTPSEDADGFGATAQLFDVTDRAQQGSSALINVGTTLRNFQPSASQLSGQLSGSVSGIPIGGYHYYIPRGNRPNFDFPGENLHFDGTPTMPNFRPAVQNGITNIPWVRLTPAAGGSTEGIGEIFRVRTSKGSAIVSGGQEVTRCDANDNLVPSRYGAEYWVLAP